MKHSKSAIYTASVCNQKQFNINSTLLNTSGWSLSAVATGYITTISGKKTTFLLDAGIAVNLSDIKHIVILLTHSHSDHWNQLHLHFHCNTTVKPIIFIPENMYDGIKQFILAKINMDCNKVNMVNDIDELCKIIPVKPNEKYYLEETTDDIIIQTIKNDNTSFSINVVDCDHGVNCVGYCVNEYIDNTKKTKKIKADIITELSDFKGKQFGDKIKEMISNNISVYEETENNSENKLFVFLGDTTCKVYDNPVIFDYPLIYAECTFWNPINKKEADDRYHTHWQDLLPHIIKHSNIKFILGHFSKRENKEYITNIVKLHNEIYNNVDIMYPFTTDDFIM